MNLGSKLTRHWRNFALVSALLLQPAVAFTEAKTICADKIMEAGTKVRLRSVEVSALPNGLLRHSWSSGDIECDTSDDLIVNLSINGKKILANGFPSLEAEALFKYMQSENSKMFAECMSLPIFTGPCLCLGNGGPLMANKRARPEDIITKLRQVEVLMGQGMSRLDAIRQIGVVEQTYYRWRKQYGGMGIDQLKELKRLQKENEQLRRAVSDLTLDKLILKEAAKGNF
jgi:putative transposase